MSSTCVIFCMIFVFSLYCSVLFFFFQAEDGIRDWSVTGVQTCALPILIKDVHDARLHESFLSLKRFQTLSTKSDPINWIFTWSSFKFNFFATRSQTNFRDRKSVV